MQDDDDLDDGQRDNDDLDDGQKYGDNSKNARFRALECDSRHSRWGKISIWIDDHQYRWY